MRSSARVWVRSGRLIGGGRLSCRPPATCPRLSPILKDGPGAEAVARRSSALEKKLFNRHKSHTQKSNFLNLAQEYGIMSGIKPTERVNFDSSSKKVFFKVYSNLLPGGRVESIMGPSSTNQIRLTGQAATATKAYH